MSDGIKFFECLILVLVFVPKCHLFGPKYGYKCVIMSVNSIQDHSLHFHDGILVHYYQACLFFFLFEREHFILNSFYVVCATWKHFMNK